MARDTCKTWDRTVSVERPDGSTEETYFVALRPREMLEKLCMTAAPDFARGEQDGVNARMGHQLGRMLTASIDDPDHTVYCLAMIGFCELKRRHDEQQDPHDRGGRSG